MGRKKRIFVPCYITTIFAYFFRCSFLSSSQTKTQTSQQTSYYGRLLSHGSACLAWDSHYMFRNFLLSTSRRVLYVMTDNQQAKQTLRVGTFNVLAPCYNWLRYVSLGSSLTSMSVVCVSKTRRNTRRFSLHHVGYLFLYGCHWPKIK